MSEETNQNETPAPSAAPAAPVAPASAAASTPSAPTVQPATPAQPAAPAEAEAAVQIDSVGASESSHSAAQQPTPHSAAQPVAPATTQPLPSQQVPPAPTQPTPNPMPPTYQQPTYQQQPAQPVAAPAPLTQLSGGMKFGWFVIGVLVGIPGILIAWLANVDKLPQVKADAVKFSAIGLVVWAVLWALACLGFLSIVAAVLSSLFGDFSSSYGMYY